MQKKKWHGVMIQIKHNGYRWVAERVGENVVAYLGGIPRFKYKVVDCSFNEFIKHIPYNFLS